MRRLAACAAVLLTACSPETAELPQLPGLSIRSAPIEPGVPPSVPLADPKNLIVVSLDTLRADHLPTYGYSRQTSPAIDRFAESAVVFEQAYSHAPRTAQSHMSLFTSLYPIEHGVVNFQDGEAIRLDARIPTLATLLQRAGYRTEAYVAGGNLAATLGFDRGFDVYDDSNPRAARHKFGRAVEFLRSHAAQAPDSRAPFFLFVHTYDIHEPYLAASGDHLKDFTRPDYAGRIVGSWQELRELGGEDWSGQMRDFWSRVDRSDPADITRLRDLYDACIRSTDDQVGRLLDALRALRLDRDTIVVLLSDHGEEFGDHGGFTHEDVYQECLHVPLLMRFPTDELPAGSRIPEIVRLIDVLPTLLDYLDLEAPRHLQGESLLPLVRRTQKRGRPVFSEYRKRGFYALRAGRWKLIQRPPGERSLHLGPWQVPLPGRTRPHEIYEVAIDGGETSDEASRLTELGRRMQDDLRRAREAMAANRQRRADPILVEPDAEVTRQLKALGYIDD